MLGKKHKEESKQKISDGNKGRVAWNKGKKGPTPWNKGITWKKKKSNDKY